MQATSAEPVSSGRLAGRGPITFGIVMATVMSALDTTVANIALPHIQGSLSASPEQITWLITSYVVATAVATPVSGWMASRLGLKRMLLFAIAGFTAASVLCGLATTLPQMVLFRVLQGALSAPLMPLCQAVLLNINPPERHGRAMALFTMAAVVAPVVGPVVGGYLTEELSWRWCFYINVPAGLGVMLLLGTFLPDEARQRRRFDFLGFGSLALAVAAFQLMLDRGPTLDWFSSVEICTEGVLAAAGFWVFLAHTLTADQPLFDPALARDGNFVASAIFGFFYSLLVFSSFTLLPLMMQGLMGYPVLFAGLVSMPRGVLMLLILQVTGRIDALADRRLLVGLGLFLLIASFWQMSLFDLSMSGREIVMATLVQGAGQGIIFVPLATLAFATLDPALRAEGAAMNSLLRNIGGSVGVALMQAVLAFNSQRMHAALASHIVAGDPLVRATLPATLSPETASGALALNAEISRQATMVAFVDDFRLLSLIGIACIPLLLLLREPARRQTDRTQAILDAHGG